MSQNGVVVRGDRLPAFKTIEQWGAGLKWIVQDWRDRKWRVAEYLVRGDKTFGDLIWQYVDPRELKMRTQQEVSNAMWTYRQIGEQYTAEANLSFDMWRELASLKPLDRDPFITRALSGDRISRDEIRIKVKGAGIRALAASKNGAEAVVPENPLVEALLLVGKLLSREAKGENVDKVLAPALDELIALSMARLEKLRKRALAH